MEALNIGSLCVGVEALSFSSFIPSKGMLVLQLGWRRVHVM